MPEEKSKETVNIEVPDKKIIDNPIIQNKERGK